VKRFRCEKALEIGVGSGRFGSYINILAGIDPSIRLLEKARDIEKILGYGEYLPFREGSFECSFLIVTLCFVKDPYEVVREALRVPDNVRASLALQGGVYFISFYNIFEGRVFGGQKI
jgi:ubiquinone/menaquinone biosynthesis C-methylase UbiE